MTFICFWNPDWTGSSLAELAPLALRVVPRIALNPARGLVWADVRSLSEQAAIDSIRTLSSQYSATIPQAGVSLIPVAAEVAATHKAGTTHVPGGAERAFLGPFPILVLEPSPALSSELEAVGIESCADLACLEQNAVEVRFGAEGVELWRLARADDRRLIFGSVPRLLPESSLDWVDYVLTDPERLVFVINALVENVSTELRSSGQTAREMTLVFSLAGRSTFEQLVRPARATASRKAWMRLIRTQLDTLELPDAVTGIALRVESVTGAVERQGDLFDRGFSTAKATEEAMAQLLDDQGAVIVVPRNTRHPLPGRRTSWVSQDPAHAARAHMLRERLAEPQLTLQLLASPCRIAVATRKRRDHAVPVRYREEAKGEKGSWIPLKSAAGPERVSGGQWEEPYAREYFRCVTEAGELVWLFRASGEWYLEGWWD